MKLNLLPPLLNLVNIFEVCIINTLYNLQRGGYSYTLHFRKMIVNVYNLDSKVVLGMRPNIQKYFTKVESWHMES